MRLRGINSLKAKHPSYLWDRNWGCNSSRNSPRQQTQFSMNHLWIQQKLTETRKVTIGVVAKQDRCKLAQRPWDCDLQASSGTTFHACQENIMLWLKHNSSRTRKFPQTLRSSTMCGQRSCERHVGAIKHQLSLPSTFQEVQWYKILSATECR